jgi:galactokinase
VEGTIRVSTPSRLCLFGEHQYYLGLEVVALAINLRFFASVTPRDDGKLSVKIRDCKIDTLGQANDSCMYEETVLDLTQPIQYSNNRDYIKSTVNLLLKEGIDLWPGYNVVMDSEIPIGKGMCSSTTMIMALLKGLMEAAGVSSASDPDVLADLGFRAEVVEFGEPGGMMDHYTSAYGRLVNLSFYEGVKPSRLPVRIPGCFVLFDSLKSKDTIKVLASAKKPVLEALETLNRYGIHSVRDFYDLPERLSVLSRLDEDHRRKLFASIDNYAVLREAVWMLRTGRFDDARFGQLLTRHHKNLRDGLGISSSEVEQILDTALAAGALGGKINGSGGGGCCFAYCRDEDAQAVLDSVAALGYPGMIVSPDEGTRIED